MALPFSKPALTFDQQIDKLSANGMNIRDRAEARHALQHISYYRLSAYWLIFEVPKQQIGPRFYPGTKLDTVLSLYDFDRKLRLLVLDAIERLEVAIRGSWAYELALIGGPHGYTDHTLYSDNDKFQGNLDKLAKDVKKSRDTFIRHYKQAYSGPAMPPIWMASELMSLGQLSHWYAALKKPSLRQAVARPFSLDETVFVPFTHHLSVVRNICAHHGRLWNRTFDIPLRLPRRQPEMLAAAVNRTTPTMVYNT